jgi:hypothetical protein
LRGLPRKTGEPGTRESDSEREKVLEETKESKLEVIYKGAD